MIHPPFNPTMPKGYQYAVLYVTFVRTGWVVTYECWSETGYREQRTAFIAKGNGRVKWDMINKADDSLVHVKERRAQKVERVRLLPLRRRHW